LKALTILAVSLVMSGIASANTIILLHGTGDSPVFQLSGSGSILGVWGTPGASNGTSDTQFYTSGINDVGTNMIQGLNLIDNTTAITSISLYAYGTVDNDTISCSSNAPPSTPFFSSCSGATSSETATISQSDPLVFTWSGGTIAAGTEFRIADNDTINNSDLFYLLEINGATPPTATPEPATVIPMGAGLLAMGLLVARRRKAAASN
jgi:hypothetical protein